MTPQFIDILLDSDGVSESAAVRARSLAGQGGGGFARALTRLGIVGEEEVADAQAQAFGVRRLDALPEPSPETDLPTGLNKRFLDQAHVAYCGRTGNGSQLFAFAEPDDHLLKALDFACGGPVEAVVATFAEVEKLQEKSSLDFFGETSAPDAETLAQLSDGDSDAPIIRLVQSLLAGAAQRRASDVHLEPMSDHLVVRYRIDGRLNEAQRLPAGIAGAVASRIKVMASLDIAETRLPQDGRLQLVVQGRRVDVRVSTSPTAFGEGVVLRLLGRTELPLDLALLGLPEAALSKLHRALDRPHGIILLTGPTGSGKTTTLYAAINRLRRPEVKILTVEDPVEVLLDGINQVQVRPEIGLSYAHTLRSFLRQDPDILMIGEIRDRETAEIALRAALTGHLVLSTLHTNSTVGAFTRLTDIGIEPYLAASTVNAVIAQRLIRTLCPQCCHPRSVSATERALFLDYGIILPEHVHDAVGCLACQETGYQGRMPLIEVLEIHAGLREAIRGQQMADLEGITPPAETLLGHGLTLIAQGRTSFTEVNRAVQTE